MIPSTPLPANPDVVIVGAGAAGIGAGLALMRLGVPFVILEAKQRLGGRAFTDTASIGEPWDQGCYWLHAARRNPLRALAERLGHPFVRRDEEWASRWFSNGRELSPAEREAGADALATAFEASTAAGEAGLDISLAEAAGGLHGPYGAFARFVFEAIGSGPAGDSSTVDTARYDGEGGDYPVSGGYGRLIERLGEGLPVRLGCAVSSITSAPGALSVATPEGTIRAKAVILTVSNNVLGRQAIRLEPALPASLQSAIEALPCGDCEKMAAALSPHTLPDVVEGRFLVERGSHVYSLQVRPFGRPIMTCYVAGETARHVGGLSDADGGALLGEILASIFGSGTRAGLGGAAVTRWSRDPHVLGAYTYARAGRAAARPVLLAADLAPLFLAGEAHSLDWYSTAHGAYLSGISAAHRAAEHLGRPPIVADPLWLPAATSAP